MASINTRLNIKKLDGNIVQKHGSSKQVGFKQLGHKQIRFKQLGPGVETGFHRVQDKKNVFGLRWNCRDREAEVFKVSNDDATVTQRRLRDKQPEEKTNTDCLQEGAEGNVAGKKKVKESMKANLGKLLKYNAWLTRWSPVRGSIALDKDVEYRLCLSVTPKVEIVGY
ncbi:hypothetical protein Tco_0313347 [Tanacetum coccineum]